MIGVVKGEVFNGMGMAEVLVVGKKGGMHGRVLRHIALKEVVVDGMKDEGLVSIAHIVDMVIKPIF